jgi:hypothetical protein
MVQWNYSLGKKTSQSEQPAPVQQVVAQSWWESKVALSPA